MMVVVMRQGPLAWSPYPTFLCGTSQTTRKPQFLKPAFFTVSSLEEDRERFQKKMPKRNIAQRLAAVRFEEIASFRFPPVTFVATNALMLATPFNALAETCEADNSIFKMPLLLFVSLVGATVGGLLARQRRGELQRLNEQLRQINAALRRQAKIESYAPTLSYAPVSGRIAENEVIIDPRKEELISCLKNGKNFLRNQDLQKAFSEFKTALTLAQNLKDPIEEKKAARGLGASLQRQGKYREAIKYHSMVLEISKREGEESGNTEAYGAIADCYTELGDLEKAAKFYDQYIARHLGSLSTHSWSAVERMKQLMMSVENASSDALLPQELLKYLCPG